MTGLTGFTGLGVGIISRREAERPRDRERGGYWEVRLRARNSRVAVAESGMAKVRMG